ncbi:MAG: M20/M25/M40 family metallo-hydrolase [Acutalibacteraceae bacterium]|nr:M20/M25/M40 family metallo-hydrolase [Acutalibacteraceae bacterium]
MIALYIILFIIAVFFAVIIIRALAFNPKSATQIRGEEIIFDKDKATENLRKLITFKTVSNYDKNLEDEGEFGGLIDALPELFPNVFKSCSFEKLPDRALLFKWKGKNEGDPAVLMAHYDVVPVNEENWEKPAFEGIIEDGVLWGRGTLDTKGTFSGILTAADKLIEDGFVPENDIYFAFSGGEEINGQGAVRIVDYFEEKGITPALVVDEGGAVVENVFPGVNVPCGLIGIAEKGMMNVRYTARSSGGHASAPKPNSPVVRLAKACMKLENNPFKRHLTKPVADMFDTLGRHSSFVYKLIFANLWCFGGILDIICKKGGGELNAMMRTTVAFTQTEGSAAPNVIPPKACLVSNMRLNPADRVDTAYEYLKKTVSDKNIDIEIMESVNPSRISDTNCDGYKKVAMAVASTWKGCIVSPYLMVQCSDSRHYGRISDRVYRFSAMDLTGEERATIHGNNERVRLECIHRAVEFYIRLMKEC